MAVPLDKFIQQLEDSGIIAGDILKDFIPPKASPKDAEELALELVHKKKLTKFQAEEVSKGKGKSLVLGNYVLMEKIGAGGMGQVFKAEHRRMHRIVAIKVLPPSMTKDVAAIARFEREVTAAAKISHPNIVAAHDADCANGVHFLVMELVEGSDLSALIKRNGPLSLTKAVNYVLQAAKGLEAAHAEGIVHRDIKPANLLLDKKGTVKILDMGLARIHGDAGSQAELTATGAVMGTVDYMPPEQALNTKTADARADIYSLGCSLFYLLTGKATYDGDTLMAKLLAHRDQPIPSLRAAKPEVPEQIEAIFKKMVAKDLRDRFQTMREVISALESNTSHEQTITIQRPLGSSPDTNLTNFLKDISAAPTIPIHTKRVANPLIEKGRGKLLLVLGGGIGVLFLLAVLVLNSRTKRETAKLDPSRGQAIVSGMSKQPAIDAPGFKKWIKGVASMSAEDQVEAVTLKMQEVNPGFDGKFTDAYGMSTPNIVNHTVTELGFVSDNVTDISPVRALTGLRRLNCRGSDVFKGKLADLSPLQGMKLVTLDLSRANVTDLSPLKGMPLTVLTCGATPISDLSPLKGLPLTSLNCYRTKVSDLSPLTGMKLNYLNISLATMVSNLDPLKGMPLGAFELDGTAVRDLSPLKGMPLQQLGFGDTLVVDLSPLRNMTLNLLNCPNTPVNDLSPLQGMPLKFLHCFNSQVSDLLPLEGIALDEIRFTPKNITNGMDVIRQMKSLKTIGIGWEDKDKFPPDEFWKKYDAGEFGKPQ